MGRERRAVFSIFGIMVLISILFISIPEAQADSIIITLVDKNAEIDIELGETPEHLGANSWEVDSIDNLFQQWFWFRVGSEGGEFPLDTLTLDPVSPSAEDLDEDEGDETLTVTYSDGECLSVEITWTLKGGPIDSGASTIFEEIVITDPCGDVIHFFQYSDFDLGGVGKDFTDDTVVILGESTNVALQTDVTGSTFLSETVVDKPPDHSEVGLFADLLIRLNNGDPTTLDDSTGPIDGDVIWAFQWDIDFETIETFTIGKCKRIGPLSTGITGNIGCEPIAALGKGADGHEPPTIGMNLRGNYQIVENGICIDAQCWTVTENFHVDFELVQLFTSEHTISNTIYCSRGVDTCNHITLSAGPYHENTRNFDEALWKVSVDKNLLGELTVTKDDPDGYLGVTTCTAQITLEERWFTSCTIDFKLPTPGGFMLGVQVQDNYKGVRNWFFNDGIEIIDTFGYPSVDTEFESSLDVPRLCLSDDPDKRTSCAFAKKVQLEIERAEKLLT